MKGGIMGALPKPQEQEEKRPNLEVVPQGSPETDASRPSFWQRVVAWLKADDQEIHEKITAHREKLIRSHDMHFPIR
jgi:hypothetical protein